MYKNMAGLRLDKQATRDNILSLAKKKGFSQTEFNKSIRDMSARYRQAAGKDRLTETERYFVISQVLDVRFDDLFVITKVK